jgi:hypothetical protein
LKSIEVECKEVVIDNNNLACLTSFNIKDNIKTYIKDFSKTIECENENKKVLNGDIYVNLTNIGSIRLFFTNESQLKSKSTLGKVLYIDVIYIAENSYKNKGFAKNLHFIIDENFINILDELQLKAKADGLVVWLRLGYKCVKIVDMQTIKDRFLKYLQDKEVGKALSIAKAKYIANKEFSKIEKEFFLATEKNKINFLDFYKEEENRKYKNEFVGFDINIVNELKGIVDSIDMYREIGA